MKVLANSKSTLTTINPLRNRLRSLSNRLRKIGYLKWGWGLHYCQTLRWASMMTRSYPSEPGAAPD